MSDEKLKWVENSPFRFTLEKVLERLHGKDYIEVVRNQTSWKDGEQTIGLFFGKNFVENLSQIPIFKEFFFPKTIKFFKETENIAKPSEMEKRQNYLGILMRKLNLLLDDILTDKSFINKWKKEIKKTRDRNKILELRQEIRSVSEHMDRRKKLLESILANLDALQWI